MTAAQGEYDAMLAKSEQHDAQLLQKITAAGGPEYAQVSETILFGDVAIALN